MSGFRRAHRCPWCATTSQGAPRLAPVARVACKGVLWGVVPATGHHCRRGPHKVENGCPRPQQHFLRWPTIGESMVTTCVRHLVLSGNGLGAAVPEMGRGVRPAASGVLLRLWSPVRGEYGAPVLGGDNQLYATRGQH